MRKVLIGTIGTTALLIAAAVYVLYPPPPRTITFPDGKRFAFSIIDDTDMATVGRSQPLYDVLHRYGLRTTKTIWVLDATQDAHPPDHGDTLHDPAYRAFLGDIRHKGFEIALHGVRGGSSVRADIIQGLDQFHSEFGQYPTMHVNHSMNADNLYWGQRRWSFAPYRWAYRLFSKPQFEGDDPQSAYFWGDLVQRHVRYVNQFTFVDVNLLNVTPSMP